MHFWSTFKCIKSLFTNASWISARSRHVSKLADIQRRLFCCWLVLGWFKEKKVENRWTRAIYSYHHRTRESNCPVFELQFFLLLKWCFEHFKHAGPHLPQAEAHYQKDHSKCFPQYRVAQFHLRRARQPCQILTHKEGNVFFSSLPVSWCHWEILGQIHLHRGTLRTTFYFFLWVTVMCTFKSKKSLQLCLIWQSGPTVSTAEQRGCSFTLWCPSWCQAFILGSEAQY